MSKTDMKVLLAAFAIAAVGLGGHLLLQDDRSLNNNNGSKNLERSVPNSVKWTPKLRRL